MTVTITVTRVAAGWHRAACSCGQYQSRPRGYVGHAENCGRDHAAAKHPGARVRYALATSGVNR